MNKLDVRLLVDEEKCTVEKKSEALEFDNMLDECSSGGRSLYSRPQVKWHLYLLSEDPSPIQPHISYQHRNH